jgi:hypothetical protein
MRARGYRAVYILLGGLDGWKDEVLFPALSADASAAEPARFEAPEPLAEAGSVMSLPRVEPPAPMAGAAAAARKPRRREGG